MNTSELALTPVLSERPTSELAPRMQNEATNPERVQRATPSGRESQRV